MRSWFGSRKSVPATPVTEGSGKELPLDGATSRSRLHGEDQSKSSRKEIPATEQKLGVALSKSLVYDVDPRKRSYRPELITLHYDRLHNPDNCYHLRIEFLNTTSKLIEDAVLSWSTTVERFGLKLVEVPIAEACSINTMHPFRAPYIVKLALEPPKEQPQPQAYFEAKAFNAPITSERNFYQNLILRKFDYVLDFEAARDFPADVDVSYSWGKPDYRYVQYIHRSGTVVAQISDEGDFVLLANRLYNDRSKASTEDRPMEDAMTAFRRAPNIRAGDYRSSPSPYSSPVIRPAAETPMPNAAELTTAYARPEQLKDELEAFCSNKMILDAFYSEVLNASSHLAHLRTPNIEAGIPTIGLPPSLLLQDQKELVDNGIA